jgi:peptide/nickel transport system substrate-binding protein
MNKRTISTFVWALLLSGLLAVTGCGSQKAGDQKTGASPGNQNTLVVGELWAITSIDPANNGTLTTEKAMITESLVGVKPNFEIEPKLAASWQRIDDNTWKITLRKGIKFQDGSPLDAEAVKWSLTRAITVNPQVKDYTKIQSVDTQGDDILLIKTSEPNGDFIASLHYTSAAIIAPSSVDKDGKLIKPVGTGPFKLDSWDPATGNMKMSKFTGYWGEVPQLDYLEIRPMPDPNTRALALEKGEINFTCDPPYNELARLAKVDGLKVELHKTARTYIIEMNLKKEPFNDLKVRQALNYAIDRETIAKDVLFGAGEAAVGPFMPGMAWTNENLKGYPYSKEKAKQLLAEAGWKDTDGDGIVDKNGKPLEITLFTYPERPGLPLIAQAVQAQYKEVGITLKTSVMNNSAMSEEVKKGTWDMQMSAFATAMIPTPSYHLQVMYQSDKNKLSGYNNPQLDQLITACRSTDDLQKKYGFSKEAQQILENDAATIPVAYYGIAVAMNDKVQGYEFNPTAHDYNLSTKVTVKE